jgi:hypothetical protein
MNVSCLVGVALGVAGLETKQNFEFVFDLQNVSFISIKLLPDALWGEV